MIQTKNLTKIYRTGGVRVTALNKVTLSVEKGEFVAVMGSSGSGKSTLLHMIAGLDVPDSGKVYVDGADLSRMTPSQLAVFRRRRAGVIYQLYNLVPTLTVEENMILPRVLDGEEPEKRETAKMLELLGLADRKRHLPCQLSGGQQQKAAIGRALLSKSSILLADEPTGNLDSRSGEDVMKLLCEANGSYGKTILLVTHDPVIGGMAGRRIVMKDGEIVSDEVLPGPGMGVGAELK